MDVTSTVECVIYTIYLPFRLCDTLVYIINLGQKVKHITEIKGNCLTRFVKLYFVLPLLLHHSIFLSSLTAFVWLYLFLHALSTLFSYKVKSFIPLLCLIGAFPGSFVSSLHSCMLTEFSLFCTFSLPPLPNICSLLS